MGRPLVSASELVAELAAARTGAPAPVVLDVRYALGAPAHLTGRDAHHAGHVPGAAYVDLDVDLAAPPGGPDGGRHPLPDPQVFAAAMRRCGVRSTSPVVVYDDWAGRAAGRCWWLLRHHGHPDVRVLDGGWSAWVAAGGAVEVDPASGASPPTGEPGDFLCAPAPRRDTVAAEDVADVEVLLDARAPERYRGEVEPLDAVAGHVPGARNVPTTDNLTEEGLFRDVEDLRRIYAEVGAVPGADVAVYCGSGVTATHDLIALELLGVRARLYAGSWSEWSARGGPDFPAAVTSGCP